MKKVNIQSLSLMMLIAMIYAAPHGQTEANLLVDMIQEVEKIIHNKTMWENKDVQAIPTNHHHTTCVKNFFCCAEKAVNGTGLENLTRLLHQYNNITNKEGNTNCSLNEKSTVNLGKVLKDIKYCAQKRKMK